MGLENRIAKLEAQQAEEVERVADSETRLDPNQAWFDKLHEARNALLSTMRADYAERVITDYGTLANTGEKSNLLRWFEARADDAANDKRKLRVYAVPDEVVEVLLSGREIKGEESCVKCGLIVPRAVKVIFSQVIQVKHLESYFIQCPLCGSPLMHGQPASFSPASFVTGQPFREYTA
jgi:hypothetical protein